MVKCVVPISGGKDSQACLQLALEHFQAEQIRGIFCDTKYEHPETYKHVAWMAKHYGVDIDSGCGGSVLEKSLKYGRFPGGGARFCTDELKIKITKQYLKWIALLYGPVEVWYGMRTGESHERAKRYHDKVSHELYAPHEIMPSKYPQYLGTMGVRFKLPIVDWSEQDVLHYLGALANPLYFAPFNRTRVGCNPCLASGDEAKEQAFHQDDFGRQQLIATDAVARLIGKPIWTSKGGVARNTAPGCAICSI
jgi:3'-phosphoadenosine 5'-phosphosulfate sulfotransferase (PAPS reductase)/FAD synthetase